MSAGHSTCRRQGREHRKANNDWPLVEISVLKTKGGYGEGEHYEATIFSLESGHRKPISKAIVIDKATGKPAEIMTKDNIYTPKAESVFHLEQMLTHDRLKAEAVKRGLQIRSESIKRLDEIKQGLEG